MNSYARAGAAAGTTVAAVMLDQLWLLAVAAGLVGVTVLVIRTRWRRGRGLSDR